MDRAKQRPSFDSTQWTVVLRAGDSQDPAAGDALETLCKRYWYPLYAYARRKGAPPEVCEDLVQGFFADFIRRKPYAKANPERGRFRTFILTAFNHFQANEWHKAHAQKRGGAVEFIAIDAEACEVRIAAAPEAAPEILFDRAWAHTVLDTVHKNLAEKYTRQGKAHIFETLRHTLGSENPQPYGELADRLETSVANVKVLVHRIRKNFRDILRAEIAQTLESQSDIDEEIRYLVDVLASER